ncbi:hypothetical protein PHISP_03014 [Aspergillus sp. HF37]|nr:hypothetical protein PHISP_03014 [Aspergillus sp. HF37]
MNLSALNPSPAKDGRRILGEKSANACLSPSRNRRADSTPVKRKGHFESEPSPKKLLPSPEFTSRKRSIAQVEESQTNNGTAPLRRVSPVRLQLQEDNDSRQSTVADDTRHGDAVDLDTRGHHEQTQSRPDTPSHGLTPRNAVPEDPETRKVFIQEKATLLRTRIQGAMPHVRDHQFDRRLSALEAHSRKYKRLSFCASTPQRRDIQLQLQPPPLTHTPQPPPLHPAAAASAAEPNPMPPESGLSPPPLSADNPSQHDHMKTPNQNDPSGTAKSPVQLSSPPVSVLGAARQAAGADGATTEKASTLSQKGDAVDGLLKLMKTADR